MISFTHALKWGFQDVQREIGWRSCAVVGPAGGVVVVVAVDAGSAVAAD